MIGRRPETQQLTTSCPQDLLHLYLVPLLQRISCWLLHVKASHQWQGTVVAAGHLCWLGRSSARSEAPRPPHRGRLITARRGPVSWGSVHGSAPSFQPRMSSPASTGVSTTSALPCARDRAPPVTDRSKTWPTDVRVGRHGRQRRRSQRRRRRDPTPLRRGALPTENGTALPHGYAVPYVVAAAGTRPSCCIMLSWSNWPRNSAIFPSTRR